MEKTSLKGKETPRIFTPPLRDLTPDTSVGFEVIDFARDVLHIELFPWQKWLAIHALEVIDGNCGSGASERQDDVFLCSGSLFFI